MLNGSQPQLTDDVAALAARFDRLSTDHNPDYLSRALGTALEERELYERYLSYLDGDERRTKVLLEIFDKALAVPRYDIKIFKRFRQLCGRARLLPFSHILPEKLIQTSENPVASGGFCDVWEGIYHDKWVAIKALRIYKEDDVRKVTKVICKEVVIWRRISHPNIVPFLGVSEAPAPLSMVSEWMPNGNVQDYVAKNPEASRLQLLLDISRGLSFLHSLEIVHGDLQGNNILIDRLGRARLDGFMFISIASINCTETSASGFKGSHRWMAPELYGITNEGGSGLCTYRSDVFALGMVTFQVFTGQVPFPENKASAAVMKKILYGERPPRPPKGKKLGLSDDLWEIIQSSLVHEAEERPPVSTFLNILKEITPDITTLKELTEFDANYEKHVQELRRMFGYGDNTLLGMREEETLVVIEVFDRVLNSSLSDPVLRGSCLRGLQKVSARCGLLPESYWISLSNPAAPTDASAVAGRVSSTCQGLVDGKLVAVKTIIPDYVKDTNTFKRRLCTNGVIWKRLHHPNVVGFLGFCAGPPVFSLVYNWMSNGNLAEYVRRHPDVDKLGLLLDIARGLTYLHQYNLVHGNLTGHNILVDSEGTACISDYDSELILHDEPFSRSIPINVQWTAPEVLATKDKQVTSTEDGKRADIYSFAVVMFEVLSGTIPFPNESAEEVMEKVAMGDRPEWPPNSPLHALVIVVWEQVESCWYQEPMMRPTAANVLQALGEARVQEGVISIECAGDSAIVKKWERINRQSRAQIAIDIMDEECTLRTHVGLDKERLKLLNKLCKMCSRKRLLPRSMHIRDRSWEPIGDDRYGGQATVFQCTYEGRQVAVKVPYLYLVNLDNILARFCREAVSWKHLQHPNILPLLGVTLAEQRFAMVTEWVEDGNINEFIQKNPDANRTELLADVAQGLAYMHGLHLVHGDLKGANVLINKNHRACISDFGLSTITGVRTRATTAASFSSLLSNDTAMSCTPGCTTRWVSPELLDPERFGILGPENDRPTKQSDCYALGMVIYEVLSGHAPYHDISGDEMVMLAITAGVRPKKPQNETHLGFTKELWGTVKQCWLEDWRARPGVEDILSCLKDALPSWHTRRRGSVRRVITTLFGDSR